MSNKNPFEIRTELLQMAKDYMDRQYETAYSFAGQAFQTAVEQQKVAIEEWEKYMPKMYSMEDLTKKAQELYGFVTSK